jgi:Fic family protein
MRLMVEETPQPLTSAEASEIDAQYRPFPSFGSWSREIPRPDLWEQDQEELRAVATDASDEDLKRAQDVAIRAAAFDSGAIEGLYPTDRGLTLTVATQAFAWEEKVDERSADARSLFEAQLSAFELVLDLVTNRFPDITQVWIQRLHEEITAAQKTYAVQTPVGPQDQPLPRGQYKDHPNHVRTSDGRVHAYAPVQQTQVEMQRLLDELNTQEFVNAHPVLQASYAHYAFVAVHPFADGNGRVARALASIYTYRAASVPLLVQSHQRDIYFAALAAADAGNFEPFVDFTESAVREAIQLVTESIKTAMAPQPEAVLDSFREMFVVQGELTHQQLDRIANDFANVFAEIAVEQKNSLALPDGVEVEVVSGSGMSHSQPPPNFRLIVSPSPRYVQLKLKSPAPAPAGHEVNIDIFAATGSDPAATLLVWDADRPHEKLTLSLTDLQPQLSSAARYRVSSYVRRLLGTGLEVLYKKAEQNLRRAGY